MADETEPAPETVTGEPPPPMWVGLLTWVALALVALVALQVVGIVLQASSLNAARLTFSDKLGYSFLQNLDQAPLGLELLAAVVLVLLPVIVRQRTTETQDRVAMIVLVGTAALAALIAIGGIIGVPARLHILDIQNQEVTDVIQRVLFTFVIRNVGMAVLAGAAAIAAVRIRFTPRVAPSPAS